MRLTESGNIRSEQLLIMSTDQLTGLIKLVLLAVIETSYKVTRSFGCSIVLLKPINCTVKNISLCPLLMCFHDKTNILNRQDSEEVDC